MNFQSRDKQVIWHPFTQMKTAPAPLPVVRGEGAILFGPNDEKYIDAISSWWVNLHGHGHPEIAKAIFEQAQTLEHVIFAGFTHPKAIELSEQLLLLFNQHFGKVFFSDDGSTAVEVGLKIALQFHGNKGSKRKKIAALEGGYHGDTFGAMSLGDRSAFSAPFNSWMFEVAHLPFPQNAEKEEIALHQLHNLAKSGDLACFVYEPLIQGAGGMRMYSSNFLNQALKICREFGVITIADEVMTGFGRTGGLFASYAMEQLPDIICLSKGITGGFLPMGVTLCTQTIYDEFHQEDKLKALWHGHSYTGNPISCAAALASLQLTLDKKCLNQRIAIENCHYNFLESIKSNPKFENGRVLGTILAMEVNAGNSSGYFAEIRDRLYQFFIEKGVLLRPLGNTIYIMPPYCISNGQLTEVYDAILKWETVSG